MTNLNPASEGIEFRQARPEDAEGIAELYKKAYGWVFPLTEYSDSGRVKQIIEENKRIWHIAVNKKEIIGSSVGIPHKWNNSVEIGRTIIDKKFYNSKIARTLCERVKEEASKQDVDICWGHLRNKAIYNVAKHLDMKVVGYLPGLHKSEVRELHLLCMYLSATAKEKRQAPKNCTIYRSDVIKEIMKELRLSTAVGDYPSDIFAEPISDCVVPIKISHYHREKSTIIHSIDNFNKLAADYIQVTVLADKIDAMRFFSRFGFEFCAFLPAWFEKEGKRYDCVTMSNYGIKPTALEEQFFETVARFKKIKLG